MKKVVLAINAILIAVVGYLYFQQSTEEIVYVDINVLMSDYDGMKDAKKEFELKSELWQADIDSLIANFENEIKTYEAQRSKMTAKENELQQELLRNKQQQIGLYQQGVQKKYEEEDSRMTGEVVAEINSYIASYGKEHNYKVILGANSSGNILYAETGTDITQDILNGLNTAYVKE